MDEFFRIDVGDSQLVMVGLVVAALVAWVVRRRIVRRRDNGQVPFPAPTSAVPPSR